MLYVPVQYRSNEGDFTIYITFSTYDDTWRATRHPLGEEANKSVLEVYTQDKDWENAVDGDTPPARWNSFESAKEYLNNSPI